MNKIEEMKKLIKILNVASDAYYNGKETLMSDAEFDLKLKHLQELEEEIGVVLSNSPTVNVGAPVLDVLEKVNHEYKPMLSLNKCHSAEEIIKFANGHDLIAMTKLDGLSCRLTYQDGRLVKAETRGNGETGSLITEHAKQFKNIPLSIDKKDTYIIDGEAIITDEDFFDINDSLPEGVEKFKNSRNLASGTLALLDTSIVKDRKISFIAWDVIVGSNGDTIQDKLNEAIDLGFECTPWTCVYKKNITSDYINGINNIMFETSKELSYPNDGVVWKVLDVAYGETLGRTEHHFNCGIAYKAKVDSYPTKLLNVEWTMGKTGSLCPTIITEPVEIDGTSVSKASVHNVSIFKDFGFTKGCTCYLYKANLIIPQCEYVEDNNSEPFEVPSVCPICGAPTEIRKDNETEVLYCTNKDCKGLMLGKMSAFVSKQGMNIDGLSEATLDVLLNKGYIETFKDVYHLDAHRNSLEALPGFGKKSVDKLLQSIESSRKTDLAHFLTSLSINLIGKSTAKDISKYCDGSIDKFTLIMENNPFTFSEIDGVGEAATTSLNNWWSENREMFYELLNELDLSVEEEKKEVSSNGVDLTGMTFVVTGSVNHFKNRAELQEKIESLGGKVAGSVSAKTSVLLNNDVNSNSSKNVKAKSLNIPIWSEDDFLKYINELN
jgi:DNA ligase (NAD+)